MSFPLRMKSSGGSRKLWIASAIVGTLGMPAVASADPEREGAQWEVLIGAAGCIPGKADCRRDDDAFAGRTYPSFGTGASIGWRAARWFYLGGIYRFGMLDPNYEVTGAGDTTVAYQHTVGGVFRPILPVWRIDLGVNLAPGFSRQTFRFSDGRDRDYTQGFAFMVGPVVDVWVTDHVFLGGAIDFIFNVHDKVCQRRGSSTECIDDLDRSIAPVHQTVFGFHLGGTFG